MVESLLPAVQLGQTLRLTEVWQFVDGDERRDAHVQGMLNRASGRLVLTGVDGDGWRVHIQGWLTTTGGVTSIAGEVMFNPQPDPPSPS